MSAGHFWFTLKSPKKPWWLIVGGFTFILFLLGLPAYFLGYPLLREYKFHRFEKTANAALENGDTYTALLTAQTAHLLKPENLSALKTLVKTAQISNHPRLFSWQQILANHPEASFEERSSYLKKALEFRNFTEVDDWFRKISPELSEKEKVFFQCLILARGDDEAKFNAYRLASEFLEKHPYSSPICEFFWDLCIQINQSYLLKEAVTNMKAATHLSSPLSVEALRQLLQLKVGTDAERKSWAQKLWQLNEPTLYDAVLCLNASYGEKRINGNSLLNALKQNFPDLREREQANRLIGLLNQVGRPQTASQLLPEDLNFTQHKQTYLDTIQASFNSDNKNLAKDLIIKANPSLSQNERRFFNLLIRQANPKENQLSEEQLAEIFSHCNNDELDTIRLFLPFFESPDFLVGFLEEMERRNPHRVGIKYLLATSYHRLGMYDKLKEVVKRTELPTSITDLAGERQTCIQKTLYGLDLQRCTTWAELAFSQNPQNQSVRFALALCYLQKKEAGNARALLSKFFQNPPPLCPTQRLIGALTLHRNQLFELSQKWAPRENLSLLTDAEKKLLRETLPKTE